MANINLGVDSDWFSLASGVIDKVGDVASSVIEGGTATDLAKIERDKMKILAASQSGGTGSASIPSWVFPTAIGIGAVGLIILVMRR